LRPASSPAEELARATWHNRVVRAGVVLLAFAFLAAPSSAAANPSYWSISKVLRRIDGANIRVGSRTVKVDTASTLCAGVGRLVHSGPVRKWHTFVCTYTTFTKAGVDRDVEFRVYALTRTRFAVANAHWVSGLP
jgi:hypothetical protein